MTATNWIPNSTYEAARPHASLRRVLLALSAAMAGFLIYGIVANSLSVIYYLPITVVLVGVFGLIHRSVDLPTAVLWALAGVAIGNIAGGVLLIDGAPLYEL